MTATKLAKVVSAEVMTSRQQQFLERIESLGTNLIDVATEYAALCKDDPDFAARVRSKYPSIPWARLELVGSGAIDRRLLFTPHHRIEQLPATTQAEILDGGSVEAISADNPSDTIRLQIAAMTPQQWDMVVDGKNRRLRTLAEQRTVMERYREMQARATTAEEQKRQRPLYRIVRANGHRAVEIGGTTFTERQLLAILQELAS